MSYDLHIELGLVQARVQPAQRLGGRATLQRIVDEPEPKRSKWKRLLGG